MLRSEAATREVFDLKKQADTLLFLIVQLTFGPNFTEFRQFYIPEEASCRNRIASFRLLKIWKHVTLYWRIMSTPESLCEPPANNIVDPLTLMALRGKVFISHAFISPVRFCEPVFGSQVWVKPRRNQYISHIEVA